MDYVIRKHQNVIYAEFENGKKIKQEKLGDFYTIEMKQKYQKIWEEYFKNGN